MLPDSFIHRRERRISRNRARRVYVAEPSRRPPSAPRETRVGSPRHVVEITAPVLGEIYRTVGCLPVEQGGLLGGSRTTGQITHFVFDSSARRHGTAYSPDHQRLNRVLAEDWNPAGVNLMGFVHSHPRGIRHLSAGDIEYAGRILEAIPELERLFLPIVQSQGDGGGFEFLPFVAYRSAGRVRVEVAQVVASGVVSPAARTGKVQAVGVPAASLLTIFPQVRSDRPRAFMRPRED